MRAAQPTPESPESTARPSLCAAPGYAANVLRALKSRDRRINAGLCYECGVPAVDGWLCAKHKKIAAIRNRNRYRRAHGIPIKAPLYQRHNARGEQPAPNDTKATA